MSMTNADPPVVPPADDEDPAEYELVLGDTIVVGSDLLNKVQQILHWIGFCQDQTRGNLHNKSIGSFEEIQLLTEKVVHSIATDWAGRTAVLRGFYMVNQRLKYLKSVIYWVQVFQQVSTTPTIVGLNEITFKSQLFCALDRSIIHKLLIEQTLIAASTASSGSLESKHK